MGLGGEVGQVREGNQDRGPSSIVHPKQGSFARHVVRSTEYTALAPKDRGLPGSQVHRCSRRATEGSAVVGEARLSALHARLVPGGSLWLAVANEFPKGKKGVSVSWLRRDHPACLTLPAHTPRPRLYSDGVTKNRLCLDSKCNHKRANASMQIDRAF